MAVTTITHTSPKGTSSSTTTSITIEKQKSQASFSTSSPKASSISTSASVSSPKNNLNSSQNRKSKQQQKRKQRIIPITQQKTTNTNNVDRRKWWRIAVEHYHDNKTAVRNILETLSPPEVLSLARARGPDGKTRAIEAACEECILLLQSHMTLFDRFDLVSNSNDLDLTSPDSSMNDEYSSDVLALHARDRWAWVTILDQNLEEQEGVEMTLQEDNKSGNEVILRFYRFDEAFLAEIKLRERYELLPMYIETLLSHHRGFAAPKKSLSCISFEKPDHTLELVFRRTVHGQRTEKWIKKSKIVLKQIACALKHLHEKGFVHGHVIPKNIAKYGTTWKLMNICLVTPMAAKMRGPIRSCIPPESVVERLSISSKKNNRKKTSVVSFNEVDSASSHSSVDSKRDDDATKLSASSEEKRTSPPPLPVPVTRSLSLLSSAAERVNKKNFLIDITTPSKVEVLDKRCYSPQQYTALDFCPQRCIATPSWDVWGYGLIMVQLLTGRSTLLPNFEKADDALMHNLYGYDKSVLKQIHKQVLKASDADAADLIVRLLHPDPNLRPSRMGKVLRHKYFTRVSIG